MNDDKSPIDSFSVSLGNSAKGSQASIGKQLEAWDVLICSDLGFASTDVQQVKISEWNEFMAAQNIVISGAVENWLLPSSGPVFIELSVSSMKDFNPEVIKKKVSAFSDYAELLDTLLNVLDGKCGKEDALAALNKAPLAPAEKRRVAGLFGLSASLPQTKSEPPKTNSHLASILSMVDVAPAPSEETQASHSSLDGLLKTISASESLICDKIACEAYIDAGRKMLEGQLSEYCSRPFFSRKKASWQCLYQCAKAIGRKKEIRLGVLSAAAEDVDTLLEKISSELISADASPDLIVWDFPVTFTNAAIDRLLLLLNASDRWKSVVIAPIDSHDTLFDDLDKKEDFAPVFQDIRFLHYKKIRSKLESRALSLCGPDMMLMEGEASKEAIGVASPARSVWPVIMQWLSLSLEGDDPFAVESSPIVAGAALPAHAAFQLSLLRTMSEDASACAGLTLFNGNPSEVTLSGIRTVIDPEVAGSAYTSLMFNLLVNRVARLAGRRIGSLVGALNGEELCIHLHAFLSKELCACRVCTTADQISVVLEEGGALLITLNSDAKAGGFPVRFSFTLET